MQDQFLAKIYQNLPRIQSVLGSDWTDFQLILIDYLQRLIFEDKPERMPLWVNKIFSAGAQTREGKLFLDLFQEAAKDKAPLDITRLVRQYNPPASLSKSLPSTNEAALTDLAHAILAEIGAGVRATEAATVDSPAPRYLQSVFSSNQPAETIGRESPLALNGGPYTLAIWIGPGEGDQPFPDDKLQTEFKKEGALPLSVRVTSSDAAVELLSDKPSLDLPPGGESSVVKYQVTPQQAGRARLNIDVFYKGNLLQRQRLDVAVVEQIGQPAPPSARPPQSRQTVYTLTGDLSQEALARWDERVINLTAERDPHDQSYIILLRQGETDLCRYDSDQTETSLHKLVPNIRKDLAQAAAAFRDHPAPAQAGPLFQTWLPWLAFRGRQLFQTMFKKLPGNHNPFPALPVGSVIQVSPLGPRATLPWGLVYDRPLLRRGGLEPGTVTNPLCPAWLAGHNCIGEGCPHQTDLTVVCPSGFWGYRFIIEQIPVGMGGRMTSGQGQLPLTIENCEGTQFNMNAYQLSQFVEEKDTYQRLSQIGQPAFNFLLATSLIDFETVLQQAVSGQLAPHVIYFYSHGGRQADIPYLRLGHDTSQDYITPETLDELVVTDGALVSHPLVFLNACQSGDYSPDDYESFIDAFYRAGACGLIGAECTVWEKTARTMAWGFFEHFFASTPAGEALWLTSRRLLAENNPLGLVYSLFASGSVQLACQVLPEERPV